jgi:hypothetical protein
MSDTGLSEWEQSDLSLLETLDHVLDQGLVISGEITIAIADVDLIFIGLNVLVGSVETIKEALGRRLERNPESECRRLDEAEGTVRAQPV